jgi:hypothetical protein
MAAYFSMTENVAQVYVGEPRHDVTVSALLRLIR